MPHSLNFGEWLRRLGFKDGRQPDIIRAIQPVQVVQDVSALLPATLPVSGVCGGSRSAVAAAQGCFEVYGGTAGGVAVDLFITDEGGSGQFFLEFQTAPATLANLVVPIVTEFHVSGRRTCEFRAGTEAGGAPAGAPQIRTSNTTMGLFSFFVKPGQWATAKNATANRAVRLTCYWTEFPAESEV